LIDPVLTNTLTQASIIRTSQDLLNDRTAFVTCGDWDLKTMMPAQAELSGIRVPAQMRQWINVKTLMSKFKKYAKFHKLLCVDGCAQEPDETVALSLSLLGVRARSAKVKSFLQMLDMLGLQVEGRHHSGLDDSRNIARACVELLKQGCVFNLTKRPPQGKQQGKQQRKAERR
jgi:hypothetical protein